MSDVRPQLREGDTVGWLTIVEWHPSRARCKCRCGGIVFRNTTALNKSRNCAGEPKCKACEKKERKRKNPGGGVPIGAMPMRTRAGYVAR